MDSLPPSPSPSRHRPTTAPSSLESSSLSGPYHGTPTPDSSDIPHSSSASSQGAKSKRRAIGLHIKHFFESTRPAQWSLPTFTAHCHSFACSSGGDEYVWNNDKIYSFYIDYLNKLLDERSPLASEAKIRQLLQRAQPKRNTKLRKGNKQQDSKPGGCGNDGPGSAQDSRLAQPAPAPITIFQGTTVGAIISGPSGFSTSQTQSTSQGQKLGSGFTPDAHATGVSDPPPQYQQSSTAPRAPLPKTPPPREQDGDAEVPIPGTPPAPPPVPPSQVTFKDGSSVDLWFRTLRDKTDPTSPRYPYLLPSNILDLDDLSLPLPETYKRELLSLTTSLLPPVHEHVTYALSRFPNPAIIDSYREITESSPRPPGTPYSHQPTYINSALSHHLTLIEKFSPSSAELTPLLREGFFDSSVNPWFIDSLFLGGHANLFLSRKEILSFIPGCGEKFDAVLRYADGIRAVDLGVVEVKGEAANVNNDSKGGKDKGKVHRAMSGMLEILRALVAGSGVGEKEMWEVVKGLQVLGIVNTGFNVTILRMMYISPKVKVLRTHRTCRIGLHVDKIREVFPLLRLMVQCQTAMENTLECVMPYLRQELQEDL